MAGKRNKNSELENLSQEELQKRISDDQKKVRSSLVLAFSAMIAIIVLCMAWFVANMTVKAGSSTVSAASDVPFELASVGERQTAEKSYLLDENGNNILSEGRASDKDKEYPKYVDVASGDTISKNQVYHIGTSGLAWYLNGQESVQPGASGKLEFYIIPKRDGLKSVTVSLNMEAYNGTGKVSSLTESGNLLENKTSKNGIAVRIDNTDLNQLLSGHILLFRKLDDTSGYSEWINPESAAIQVKAPNGESFQNNVPYKVTVYWVWPKYLRNYIYGSRSINGDLFTNIENSNQDYVAIQRMINAVDSDFTGKRINRMYYNKDANNDGFSTLPDSTTDNDVIHKGMSDEVLNTWSAYYDQADEYIGSNVQFVYIQASVQ